MLLFYKRQPSLLRLFFLLRRLLVEGGFYMDKVAHRVKERSGQPEISRVKRLVVTLCSSLMVVGLIWQPLSADARTRTRLPQVAVPKVVSQAPGNSAETACLIDVDTGRILYEKNADKRMRIASLTKIITAWIAVRSGKLDQVATASQNAVRQEGSSIYLAPGEKQTLRALTYALMMRSGNDAATTIAEFLDGSTEKFAEHMNRDVRGLGLTHSHFVNPHGLDHDEHYSTAHDMAVITAAALHNPEFKKIVSTRAYTIPWQGQKWDRKMRNKNKLLWMMDGADGVKTGYTKKAGRCLASSATKDGHQVALVVLRDGNDWVDSMHLLTYGLTGYERRNVAELVHRDYVAAVRYGVRNDVALRTLGSVTYPLLRDETAEIEARTQIKTLSAPVRKGAVAGRVEYWFKGQKLGAVQLVATESVEPKGFWGRLRGIFS